MRITGARGLLGFLILSAQIPQMTACIIIASRDTSEDKCSVELQLFSKFTCTGGGSLLNVLL